MLSIRFLNPRTAGIGHNQTFRRNLAWTRPPPHSPASLTPLTSRCALRISQTPRKCSRRTPQDADVARYIVWQPHASLEATRGFIASCIAQWNTGSAYPYIITLKSSGQLIGMLEARPSAHIVNIGYVLARQHWCQGLMVEAIRAFTVLALHLPRVFRVEATCDVDNCPSARGVGEQWLSAGGSTRPPHGPSEHLNSAPRLLHLRRLPTVVGGRMRLFAVNQPGKCNVCFLQKKPARGGLKKGSSRLCPVGESWMASGKHGPCRQL
ncbi:MAG: GNAT family N-acetyltransferase [Acidovorax sp.]|uniref:GNAT family N-acetyltransferase n=1 Tax=Acidovorax sp. TaxID=1872122 RepID=UPI0039191BB2